MKPTLNMNTQPFGSDEVIQFTTHSLALSFCGKIITSTPYGAHFIYVCIVNVCVLGFCEFSQKLNRTKKDTVRFQWFFDIQMRWYPLWITLFLYSLICRFWLRPSASVVLFSIHSSHFYFLASSREWGKKLEERKKLTNKFQVMRTTQNWTKNRKCFLRLSCQRCFT